MNVEQTNARRSRRLLKASLALPFSSPPHLPHLPHLPPPLPPPRDSLSSTSVQTLRPFPSSSLNNLGAACVTAPKKGRTADDDEDFHSANSSPALLLLHPPSPPFPSSPLPSPLFSGGPKSLALGVTLRCDALAARANIEVLETTARL